MTKQFLYIRADYNDADFVAEMVEVTEEELKILAPAIKLIKEDPECVREWHEMMFDNEYDEDNNYTPEKLTPKELAISIMIEIMPHAPEGNDGIHTVEELTLYTVVKRKNLLK